MYDKGVVRLVLGRCQSQACLILASLFLPISQDIVHNNNTGLVRESWRGIRGSLC